MSASFNFNGIADEYDERTSSLSPSVFNTGSIESISKKISCLNTDLNSFCAESELIADTYVENDENSVLDEEEFGYGKLKIDYKLPKQHTKRENLSTREKEKKDLNKFAGIYSLRTVMNREQDPLDIKKTSFSFKKERKGWPQNSNQRGVTKKPMLVELHTFPGFKCECLTPLPAFLLVTDILNIVTSAQKDLNKKPGFKKEFKKIFCSYPSQAVIQDIFWWFFLEKYQPCHKIQEKLFDRVSCNYAKLMFTTFDPKYKETFFKRYPGLVAQSVYTVFCRAFPTSYRQFDEHFKQAVADLVHQWIVGIKPVRRCWQKWPLTFLEPQGMNKEEEIQKTVSQEFVIGWSGPLHDSDDKCSTSDVIKQGKRRSISHLPYHSSTQRRLSTHAHCAPEATASDGWLKVTHNRSDRSILDTLYEQNNTQTQSDPKLSRSFQSTKPSNFSLKRNCEKRESCHVGKGAEFQKVAFDLSGQSPLVKQFLKNKNLAKDSGTSILVQRTEIEKLPPIDAPTYQDIIKNALKSSQELEKQVQSLIEKSSTEQMLFGRKQRQEREEFRKKENDVLSRQNEVKRISNLILLQLAQRETADENDKYLTNSLSLTLNLDDTG